MWRLALHCAAAHALCAPRAAPRRLCVGRLAAYEGEAAGDGEAILDEEAWASDESGSFGELEEHTVVEYRGACGGLLLGVVLRCGGVQPLCCWTDGGVDLVWDEDLPVVDAQLVRGVVEAWQTQRLVDGGTGPRNPHGEDSEDVYTIDRADLDGATVVTVNEDCDIWA
ncbi:hypothetical protein M885DRAFT_506889 [Pelagophyceae sp. CCMP2097]|nr:hypothetical protein M885DRAFT_506889 [Pelagophyceae sp. CCMP2097]